jgi:predicted metal-dependent phosphoesterase TrpH
MQIKLDMHIHSEYSHDGSASVDEIAALAKARGMNALVITDHDSVQSYQRARIYQSDDFFVIPAVEYTTTRGHMLVYFVETFAEDAGIHKNEGGKYPFEKIVQFAREHDGLVIAAHLFKHVRRPLSPDAFQDVLDKVDGLEIYNGRCSALHSHANAEVRDVARSRKTPFTAGSDGHARHEMFRAYRILEFGDDEPITLASIKSKLLEPNGSYYSHPTPALFITYTKLRTSLRKHNIKRIAKYLIQMCYCLVFDVVRSVRSVFTGETQPKFEALSGKNE